jgi:hypothetical protein
MWAPKGVSPKRDSRAFAFFEAIHFVSIPTGDISADQESGLFSRDSIYQRNASSAFGRASPAVDGDTQDTLIIGNAN